MFSSETSVDFQTELKDKSANLPHLLCHVHIYTASVFRIEEWAKQEAIREQTTRHHNTRDSILRSPSAVRAPNLTLPNLFTLNGSSAC
jgi:hypothetical protein